ncbi:hypothetical protein H8R18_02550 [Nanchangia anserum]|uniref:Uncharacterized protein n=1 Tax=Nanchangia anserum TaxID=2692125 RepID=A0A8I0KP35_9ACTO|nr:hypothetical protein [Nanchangia anserum]MBD3689946.1 hypothetical protein [Nanchangia anserum]QOX82242.1 hypothetical protein H8R18_02550 [Nanchangia anserum]
MRTYQGLGLTGPSVQTRRAIGNLIDAWEAAPETVLRPATGWWAAACVDGRDVEWGGGEQHFPRLAGGGVSAFAGMLLAGAWADDAETPRALAERFVGLVHAAGWPVVFHVDEMAGQRRSGCGAADGWGLILSLIGRDEKGVHAFLEALGRGMPREEHRERARILAHDPPRGPELREAFALAATEPEPVMVGAHREVATIINMCPGTTIDRARVNRALTDVGVEEPQVFVCDAWAAAPMARALAPLIDADVADVEMTMLAYAMAALVVLGGEAMPWALLRADAGAD